MKTIHHLVDMEAPAATVWNALSTGDGLAGWWSTKVNVPPAAVGSRIELTFAGDFNPVMEITALDADEGRLEWRCVSGHDPWTDGTFRFDIATLDDGRTRLRFWQDYAVELDDDAFGTYNFNWGYYLESLRLLCTRGRGEPFQPSEVSR